jgi:hypothetical protein
MTRSKQHGAHFFRDIEPVDRTAYFLNIPVCKRIGKVYKKVNSVNVAVLPTFCPQLVVHESVDAKSDGLVLIHVPTGACIARNIPDERTGKMLAGALAFLFRWSDDHRMRIKEALADLDPLIRLWVCSWNTEEIRESIE